MTVNCAMQHLLEVEEKYSFFFGYSITFQVKKKISKQPLYVFICGIWLKKQ